MFLCVHVFSSHHFSHLKGFPESSEVFVLFFFSVLQAKLGMRHAKKSTFLTWGGLLPFSPEDETPSGGCVPQVERVQLQPPAVPAQPEGAEAQHDRNFTPTLS